jgi:hypothetical protein
VVKRWFMSYALAYERRTARFGHYVYEDDEHPLARAKRWTATLGRQDGFRVVVLSFCEVGPEVPECDELSRAVPG